MSANTVAQSASEPAIDGFLLDLLELAERLADERAPTPCSLDFGSIVVSLRVIGARFEQRLMGSLSFAQTQAASRSGALSVIAIDGKTSGIGAPAGWHFPVTQRLHLERRHENPQLGLMARFDPDTLTWRVMSIPRRRAVIWTADAAALPQWEDAAPLRDILHWGSITEPWLLVHAAGIGQNGRGLLLAGAGGSGKSTTAAACVAAGMQCCGDDFVIVEPDTMQVRALYDCIKLNDASPAFAAEWSSSIANPSRSHGQKSRIPLSRIRGDALSCGFRVDAVLLPRVTHSHRTTLERTTPAAAMRALVPSTVFLLRGGAATVTRKCAHLLRNVDTYCLELGDDLQAVATTLSDFLARREP